MSVHQSTSSLPTTSSLRNRSTPTGIYVSLGPTPRPASWVPSTEVNGLVWDLFTTPSLNSAPRLVPQQYLCVSPENVSQDTTTSNPQGLVYFPTWSTMNGFLSYAARDTNRLVVRPHPSFLSGNRIRGCRVVNISRRRPSRRLVSNGVLLSSSVERNSFKRGYRGTTADFSSLPPGSARSRGGKSRNQPLSISGFYKNLTLFFRRPNHVPRLTTTIMFSTTLI